MVLGVTEDKKITSKSERAEKYLDNIRNSNEEIKAICAADMLHNRLCALRELQKGIKIWDFMKITKEKYLESSFDKLRILKSTLNNSLVGDLEEVLKDIQDFE